MLDKTTFNPNSAKTRRSNTVATYLKTAEVLQNILSSGDRVLDYGAGKGEGTEALKFVLEPVGIHIESYEPFLLANSKLPTYSSPEEIQTQFNAIVCLHVLNVVSLDLRNEIVSHILSLLKPEGIAIIGARGWTGDIDMIKNAEKGPELRSVIVNGSIQKGFDGTELKDYIQQFTNRVVSPLSGLSKKTVLVELE